MTNGPLGMDFSRAGRHGLLAVSMVFICVIAAVAAAIFGAYAAYIVLAGAYPPAQAALMVAGAALAVALIGGLSAWLALRSARAEARRVVSNNALVALGPPAAGLALRHGRVAGVAAALALGFIAARRARDAWSN